MEDQVVYTQHFTSGPPALLSQGDVDTIAIETQEEWIKKKKVEQVTTKQIETRVKRQVVMTEDGEVLDDSGPQVTTNTTEDTETKREEHTEKKGGGDDGTVAIPEGWVAMPGAVIVREKHEKKTSTRDQTDERLETEQIHHLGQLTNEELEEALENQRETGQLTVIRRHSHSSSASGERQIVAPHSSETRIIHQSRKHKRIIDQENTEERSEEKDGKITTETTRHEHHEELDDEEKPDDEGASVSDTSSIHEIVKETRNNYTTAKDEDQVEYFAVPAGGTLASGVKLGRGPRHSNQQTVQYDAAGELNEPPAVAVGPDFPPKTTAAPAATPVVLPEPLVAERTDALTKQPLDLEAEEETRKLETSRWLDSHFGSESSYSSAEGQPKRKNKMPGQHPVLSSGGINVSIHSDRAGSDRYESPSIPPPPPPAMEPPATSRIYAMPGSAGIRRPNEVKAESTPRYAGIHERVQVLPVGPEKAFLRSAGSGGGFSSPPQSPGYLQNNSSSGYQSGGLNNGRPDFTSNISPSGVKRTASFNPSNKPDFPWMVKEENVTSNSRQQNTSLSARHSFLSSMNNNNSDVRTSSHNSHIKERPSAENKTHPEAPSYAVPIQKRWPPPPKPIDEDDDDTGRTSTTHARHNLQPQQLQQQQPQHRTGGTVIRLGPTEPDMVSPYRRNSGGVNRSQSLLINSSAVNRPVVNHSSPTNNNRMNIINSSLQSVPERERNQQRSSNTRQTTGSYFIDIDRSFGSLNPETTYPKPKVVQTFYGKTPPPRPAPPSHYGSAINISRTSESFRVPKSPPMFADDISTPPVRPVRRKQSKRIAPGANSTKTDSGTQTVTRTVPMTTSTAAPTTAAHAPKVVAAPSATPVVTAPPASNNNSSGAVIKQEILKSLDMLSRTLERPTGKPIKQYYMGEDPFREPSPPKTNGHAFPSFEPAQPPRTKHTAEVTRSQTMPRRPSKPTPLTTESSLNSSKVYSSDHDRSLNDATKGYSTLQSPSKTSTVVHKITPVKTVNVGSSAVTNSSSSNIVNRSQSFHAENQQRRLSQLQSPVRNSALPLKSIGNSPLYKSTSFLNRTNTEQFATSLKSPGIISSISRSQLDLHKSSSELNRSGIDSFRSSIATDAPQANSALYTLPRRRPSVKETAPVVQPAPPPPPPPAAPVQPQVQTGVSERLTQLNSSMDGPRGESYSSMHRRKMQQAAQAGTAEVRSDPQPQQPQDVHMNFQTTTKATHRSFQSQQHQAVNETISEEIEPEAKSLKDRIAMLESAGIHYANPAQTLPRVVSGTSKAAPPPPPPKPAETADPEKREKFLKGLLNTAPELFMHIHGDENLKDIRVEREDVIDGKSGRLPHSPSPPQSFDNSRVFTSTPTKASDPHGRMLDSAPMTPPPLLIHPSSRGSPFGSQHELALRRGSINSNGSNIIPAVKIPQPVNYSETVRIKSNQDPDSQSDSIQSFSKRVQPYIDGFTSETMQSSQQTTLTRSQFTSGPSSGPAQQQPAYQIRPQQSGGVIIQVRGSGQ